MRSKDGLLLRSEDSVITDVIMNISLAEKAFPIVRCLTLHFHLVNVRQNYS
jgi:hypothetical protein